MSQKTEYSMLVRYFLAGEREAHLLGIDIELEITKIRDKIVTKQHLTEENCSMSIEVITWLKAELAKFETTAAPVVATVESDALSIEQQIVAIGYPLIMQDALTLVTGALTGSPWAALVATLIKTAENQGHTIVATAADAALNLAKAQLVVAGTVAPVAPAV